MIKRLFHIALIALVFSGCEDPYDIDIEEGKTQLVVDAFVTNRPEKQKIILTKTVDFFEANTPPPAMGASVGLVNQMGQFFPFNENPQKPGVYEWEPDPNLPDSLKTGLGVVGDTFSLLIAYEGDTFASVSALKRTTPIDSVIFVYEEGNSFTDEGYYAELKASDPPGTGDVYWIRTWINGIYLSKAAEINVAYDASFTPNAVSDGIPFIFPIRRGINPVNDDEDEVRNDPNQYIPETPLKEGDSVYVEIWSINESTLFFLQQIQAEVNNGGLFATPPTNVRTNIFNINPNKETEVVGHFCVSAVSSDYAVLNP